MEPCWWAVIAVYQLYPFFYCFLTLLLQVLFFFYQRFKCLLSYFIMSSEKKVVCEIDCISDNTVRSAPSFFIHKILNDRKSRKDCIHLLSYPSFSAHKLETFPPTTQRNVVPRCGQNIKKGPITRRDTFCKGFFLPIPTACGSASDLARWMVNDFRRGPTCWWSPPPTLRREPRSDGRLRSALTSCLAINAA